MRNLAFFLEEVFDEAREADPDELDERLEVGTWVDDHNHFHVSLTRSNRRYSKTIAIPHEQVPTVIRALAGTLAAFRKVGEDMKEGII